MSSSNAQITSDNENKITDTSATKSKDTEENSVETAKIVSKKQKPSSSLDNDKNIEPTEVTSSKLPSSTSDNMAKKVDKPNITASKVRKALSIGSNQEERDAEISKMTAMKVCKALGTTTDKTKKGIEITEKTDQLPKSSGSATDNEKNKPIIIVSSDEYRPIQTAPPPFPFVHDVNEYMARPENDGNAEKVIKNLDELLNKYKLMEINLIAKKKKALDMIPAIEAMLDMIKLLEENQPETNPNGINNWFLLSDNVYMKSKLNVSKTVLLWLGANTMLEYTLEDARALLLKNYENAKRNLVAFENDIDFVLNQCTTIEVFIARVFNWNIKKRQGLAESSRSQISPSSMPSK